MIHHLTICLYKTNVPLGVVMDNDARIQTFNRSALAARMLNVGDLILLVNDNIVCTKEDVKQIFPILPPECIINMTVYRPVPNPIITDSTFICLLIRGCRGPGKTIGLETTRAIIQGQQVLVISHVDLGSIFCNTCLVGDYIISVNGQKVPQLQSMQQAAMLRKPDMLLEIARTALSKDFVNQPSTIQAYLHRIPGKHLGIEIGTVRGKTMITGVSPDVQTECNIQINDVISHIGNKPIYSTDHARVLIAYSNIPIMQLQLQRFSSSSNTVSNNSPVQSSSNARVIATISPASTSELASIENRNFRIAQYHQQRKQTFHDQYHSYQIPVVPFTGQNSPIHQFPLTEQRNMPTGGNEAVAQSFGQILGGMHELEPIKSILVKDSNQTKHQHEKHVSHVCAPEVIEISLDEDLDPNKPRRKVPKRS